MMFGSNETQDQPRKGSGQGSAKELALHSEELCSRKLSEFGAASPGEVLRITLHATTLQTDSPADFEYC